MTDGDRGLTVDARIPRGDFEVVARLAVAAAETVALLGPNGSGKSTLVRTLAGLLAPRAGRIVLAGRPLDDPAAGVRVPPRARRVGVAFQDPLLFAALSVRDNVAYGVRARGASREAARGRAERWLARLGLESLGAKRPAELSGGQAQRVALARALASESDLVLLDEPLSAQDVEARGAARRTLGAALAERGVPAIVVTHEPVEALTLGDRVVVLEAGRVVQAGTAEQLRRRPASPYVAALAGVNLVRGTIARAEDGGLALRADGVTLVVARDDLAPGVAATALVPPTAIALHAERPDRTSARNLFGSRVVAVDRLGSRVRVTLDTAPPLTAEVTAASLERLALGPGTPVWASIKATEVEVEPEPSALDAADQAGRRRAARGLTSDPDFPGGP